MICSVCGKKIIPSKGNFVLVGGQPIHKKCPKDSKSKLSKEESTDRKVLLEKVSEYLVSCPKGYVAESGLNFTKLSVQIGKLKKDGYSYKDQLYALNEVVKMQNGFWGYTAVVNNIYGIMKKKHDYDKVIEQSKTKTEQVVEFDLGTFMKESDDEW